MRHLSSAILGALLLALPLVCAATDEYDKTIGVFKRLGESDALLDHSVGYAVFPTISKGVGVGGAYGEGGVYKQGNYIGDPTMIQVTVGFQFGGQAYSQIIFCDDEEALNEFTSGNLGFGAQASAVAISAGAQAAGTTASRLADVSGDHGDAQAVGKYTNQGMGVFTLAKGGLLYEASNGGQKSSYTPR